MNTPPPKLRASIYSIPQSEPPPSFSNPSRFLGRGLVLARVSHINSITSGQTNASRYPSIRSNHYSTPRGRTRQRSGSFSGSLATNYRASLETPRLAKASSLSSLSTVATLELDPGLFLDGDAGNLCQQGHKSTCIASPEYISRRNKVPGLASYTSSRLALVRRSLPNLAKIAKCTPPRTLSETSDINGSHSLSLSVDQTSGYNELLTTDGTRDAPKKRSNTHICHNCKGVLVSDDLCHNCGHEFCYKCIGTIPSKDVLSTDENTEPPMEENLNQAPLLAQPYSTNHRPEPAHMDYLDSDGESMTSTEAFEPVAEHSAAKPSIQQSMYPQMEPRIVDNKPMTEPTSTTLSTTNQTESLSDVDGSYETTPRQQPTRHGANYCLCCVTKHQDTRRQSVEPVQQDPSFSIYEDNTQGGDTSTSSSLSQIDTSKRESLVPGALQPHRQDSNAGSDPFRDHRLLRPHPHLAEPEVEEWPQLRRVTRPVRKRPEMPATTVPWRRSALRKVSRRPSSRRPVKEEPRNIEPWTDSLRRISQTATQPLPVSSSPPRTPDSPTGNRRDTRVFFDRNRSESSKRGGLVTSHEPTGHPVSSRGSGISPKNVGSSYHSPNSPKLSVRQVEQLLAQGVGRHGREPSTKSLSKESLPATPHSFVHGSPSSHACSWKDRFMDLSAEVDHLKSELASCEDASSDSKESGSGNDIEGLTIIIHFKGRDDLVVNTDLRNR